MKTLKNNKGFTLVEVIVVLVILAILAALLVPSLTGYIDRANEKTVVVEARSILMAAQTLASDMYVAGKASGELDFTTVVRLAEVNSPGTITSPSAGTVTYTAGRVNSFTYRSASGKTAIYSADSGKIEIAE